MPSITYHAASGYAAPVERERLAETVAPAAGDTSNGVPGTGEVSASVWRPRSPCRSRTRRPGPTLRC